MRAVASVIRVAVEAWLDTVMIPRIFPVGPDGWTTFWTWAVIVRLVSLRIVTVMCRRPGAAIAVTMRTTERSGRGARNRFRRQGARRIGVAVAVRMGRISSGTRGAGIPSTHPIAPDPPPDLAHIIVPAEGGSKLPLVGDCDASLGSPTE